ncbi:type II toxin-antitoxin system RelE family toxin [Actinopolymorpha rutila]
MGPAFRIRIGRYRIVYEIEDHTVTVLVIHIGRTT